MRVDEFVSSIQTYEMTLPSSQKATNFVFNNYENEEKDIGMPYNITIDELGGMAKMVKRIMKCNKRFYKNQKFGKGKRPDEQSSNEKAKGSSKGKKVECFKYGGLGHYSQVVLVPNISKSLCKRHGVTQILKRVLP